MSEIKRQLKSLLQEFQKRLPKWEWSDIVKWLKKIETQLKSFNGHSIPCKRTLAKRLTQCLNPNLPQGPHSVTLKILKRVFQICEQSDFRKADMSLFSAGLLPFFQYATPDNKQYVLEEIIDKFFIALNDEASFAIPGIVRSLLPSMNDVINPVLERKIVEILQKLSICDFHCYMDTIGECLLSAPHVRHGALVYLSKIPVQKLQDAFTPALFVKSLIKCLSDEDVQVKKATLDLCKSHFPINSSFYEEALKQEVLTAMFSLLTSSRERHDFNLKRRIEEWCFQDDLNPSEDIIDAFLEIAIPVLTSMFNEHPSLPAEALGPLNIINSMLELDELCKPLFQRMTETLLDYAYSYQNDSHSQVVDRTIEIITKNSDHYETIYGTIDDYLNTSIQCGNTMHSLRVVRFFLDQTLMQELHGDDINLPFTLPLLYSLLSTVHTVSEEAVLEALALIHSILRKIEDISEVSIDDSVNNFFLFFNKLCQDNDPSVEQAVRVAVLLAKYTDEEPNLTWIDALIKLVDSANLHLSLVAIKNLVKLLRVDDSRHKKYHERVLGNEDIVGHMMGKLWNALDEKANESTALVLKLYERYPEVVTERINLQIDYYFPIFWERASAIDNETLKLICEDGTGVFQMIDFLADPVSERRQKALEWVYAGLENFKTMIDPIFQILLESIQIQFDFPHYYIENYEASQKGDMLKKLRLLTRNAAQPVFYMARKKLSGNLSCKLEEDFLAPKYLQLMITTPLQFIRAQARDPEFVSAHNSIRAQCCEFLAFVLAQKDIKLAFYAAENVLICLKSVMDSNDSVIELLLLQVLEVIFFDCKINRDQAKFKELLQKQAFIELYKHSIRLADPYIMTHWISFVTQSFSVVAESIQSVQLTKILESLVFNFCNGITKVTDSSRLFLGLKCLIHDTLNIGTDEDALKSSLINSSYPELMQVSKPKRIMQKIDKIHSRAISTPTSKDFDAEVISCMLQQLTSILKMCIKYLSEVADGIKITVAGSPNYVSKVSFTSIENEAILDLLKPIQQNYFYPFVSSVMDIWTSWTVYLESEATIYNDLELSQLMRLCVSLSPMLREYEDQPLVPIQYLRAIHAYLHEKQLQSRSLEAVAHFMYSLFSCFPPEEMLFESPNEKEAWAIIISILKIFESSPIISIWNMELLNLFFTRFENKFLQQKRRAKELRDFTQRLITQIAGLGIAESKDLVKSPLPPSTYEVFKNHFTGTIDLVALLCLDNCLYNVVNILWNNEPAKVIQGITTQLLSSVIAPQPTLDGRKAEIVSQFLGKIFKQVGEKLIKIHRREIVDYISSCEFFGHLVGKVNYMNHWQMILNAVFDYCSKEAQLEDEILSKVQTGLFVSREKELIQKMQALKSLSFLLYSGPNDSHSAALMLLTENLKDYMKNEEDLVPSVFFCFRVMVFKFSQNKISEVWPSLWPHVLMMLNKILVEQTHFKNYLAALKLLQFLILANNEEFQIYEWIFFNEANVDFESGYIPLVQRIFEGSPQTEERENLIRQKNIVDIQEARSVAAQLIRLTENLNGEKRVSDRKVLASLIEEEFLSEYL